MVASKDNFPLLAELLAEQGRLDTPVARFSEAHDRDEFSSLVTRHSSQIPLSRPEAGEQYAFEVDLDSCSGCKACVAGCHSLNGLDDEETWRDVGLLTGGDHRRPFQQTVTTACHHCEDPACLNGCPVLAYEKDPVTGIVLHLDDQCIGCQYCVLKCPYDAPKYSSRLGIVRKCDMCHGRLSAGEAPACVQACPTEAISIKVVKVAARRPLEPFLAGAPEPAYTRPTTLYITSRRLPDNLVPGDAAAVVPQPSHWPLAALLTLMPLAVGSGAAGFPVVAVAAGGAGLGVSALHLGRPLRAWRVFLGWRASWLSREAMVFGAWMGLAVAALRWPALGPAPVAIVGMAGLFCSAMVYADTRRQAWRLPRTLAGFLLSALVSAAAVSLAAGGGAMAATVLGLATLAAAGLSASRLKPLDQHDADVQGVPALATARVLWGPLRGLFCARMIVGLGGGIALPLLVLSRQAPAIPVLAVPLACVAAEFLERLLFFRTVDAPKMPGMPA